MSASLIYIKIHHNRLKPTPLNAHPHLIQPLPQLGLACLSHLTQTDYPFNRSDIRNSAPPTVKTASTVFGLLSIAFGLHVLKNGMLCFNTPQNLSSSPQQDVQCLNTGTKYPTFKINAFKPLRRAVPFIVIWSPTTSTSQPIKSARLVQKVFPRHRSAKQAGLVLPSTPVQPAVPSNREAFSSIRKGITSSSKAIPSVSPAILTKNLAFNVPGQGEIHKKMTKNLHPSTPGPNVVSHDKTRASKTQGQGKKQEGHPAKSCKRFNRRRRIQPRAAKNEVEANKSGAADLASEGQHPGGNSPEKLNCYTGNLGDMAQPDVPPVRREMRRAPRKSRVRRRKNVTPSGKEVKDVASATQRSSLCPPLDVNKLARDTEKPKEEGLSHFQACIDNEGAREATIKRKTGSKNRKHRRAKKVTEKALNHIGEQNWSHTPAPTKVNETEHEHSEAQENAVGPSLFLSERALKQTEVLDAPQGTSSEIPKEVGKRPRFGSQDVRNDASPRNIVKRRWKPRRGKTKR